MSETNILIDKHYLILNVTKRKVASGKHSSLSVPIEKSFVAPTLGLSYFDANNETEATMLLPSMRRRSKTALLVNDGTQK